MPFIGFLSISLDVSTRVRFISYITLLLVSSFWIGIQKKFWDTKKYDLVDFLPIRFFQRLHAYSYLLFRINNVLWFVLLSPFFLISVQPYDYNEKILLLLLYFNVFIGILVCQISILYLGEISKLIALLSTVGYLCLTLVNSSWILLAFLNLLFPTLQLVILSYEEALGSANKTGVPRRYLSLINLSSLSLLKVWLVGMPFATIVKLCLLVLSVMGIFVVGLKSNHVISLQFSIVTIYLVFLYSIYSITLNAILFLEQQSYVKYLALTHISIIKFMTKLVWLPVFLGLFVMHVTLAVKYDLTILQHLSIFFICVGFSLSFWLPVIKRWKSSELPSLFFFMSSLAVIAII